MPGLLFSLWDSTKALKATRSFRTREQQQLYYCSTSRSDPFTWGTAVTSHKADSEVHHSWMAEGSGNTSASRGCESCCAATPATSAPAGQLLWPLPGLREDMECHAAPPHLALAPMKAVLRAGGCPVLCWQSWPEQWMAAHHPLLSHVTPVSLVCWQPQKDNFGRGIAEVIYITFELWGSNLGCNRCVCSH